ncbi:hypothetical protein [Streptomyces mirabilis]|uniref:hypothetical protein n=1 Tax=Streptomyces mirabilis TaxID=68239 RepID=UPI0036DC2B15
MPEQLTFALNPGSLGYRVLDRQDNTNCYGVVWHSLSGSNWVAEYPGTHPGIPGFASRHMAARFLYRYRKPQPSGRP